MRRYYPKDSLLTLGVFLFNCCSVNNDASSRITGSDTTNLIQTVLSDDRLVSEVKSAFGDEQFKFIEGSVIKPNQSYTFDGKPVKIVPPMGDDHQIHERHRYELYVSVASLKFFTEDSASVLLIYHAGNASDLYTLKRVNKQWLIKGHQTGKY